ncbi:GntR family transcriptional regulator [Paenibacillus pinihumi]|uniref:GntR family transcriptional regulator n=1 Tax=Paenibacillus pinihumi TaxID=669462 RepID=UPI0004126D2C|nr:GntR family transcriptional regulator [Paenibacillus pinihumi]
MVDKEFVLQVDHELTFNVNTQIKEQLKWLIGTGHIAAGDMLPSANQLAEELRLNRNTINWVYTQLRDEGLVTMQKGRGTQVTDGLETQQLRKERMPMQGIVENAVREAKAEGFGLQPFFLASLAYILLHNPRPAGKLRILFVECEGHDYPFYRQAIEKSAGAEVETLFLDECSRPGHEIAEIVQRNHIIVTTLNHADEVKTAFAPYDRKVVVIGATVDSAALLEISRLEHGTNVAFVCLGTTGGDWMASRVREAGIEQIRYETIGWNESEQAADAYGHLDKIFASAAVFPALKALVPDKVALFPMQLEKSSENLLQDISLAGHQPSGGN